MQAQLLHAGRDRAQQTELHLERGRSDDLEAQITADAQRKVRARPHLIALTPTPALTLTPSPALTLTLTLTKFDFQARIDAVAAEGLHARLRR